MTRDETTCQNWGGGGGGDSNSSHANKRDAGTFKEPSLPDLSLSNCESRV